MNPDIIAVYNRLQQIHVLLDDGDRRSLNSMELTSPQYHLLLHLATRGGGPGLTITELADLLICTRSNATRMVQRLEQSGLVELNRSDEDRRLVRVTLTKTGAESFARAQALHTTSLKRRFAGLTPVQLEKLDELTRVLVAALEADLATQD